MLRALRERNRDDAWRTRGVCQSVDPETFFPAPSESPDEAIALCHTCEVQGACLAWALEAGDCHGVWGATTPRERRAMLVAWRGRTAGDPEAIEEADFDDVDYQDVDLENIEPPLRERVLALTPVR